MPIAIDTALANARLEATSGSISSHGAASLRFYATGGAVLATVTLANPVGAVFGGVLTLYAAPGAALASADGEVVSAEVVRGDGSVAVSGLTVSISGGGGQVQLDSLTINIGDSVAVTGGSLT